MGIQHGMMPLINARKNQFVSQGVNKPDKKGRTMLWRAARGGHTEVVAELLAVDTVNPNASDKVNN